MPIFLDFEASGLGPASYPIEVAWGDPRTGEVESHLIDPTLIPEWDDPMDATAVMMHGLTRDYLAEHGEHPAMVTERMNTELMGLTVHAGSHYDRQWLAELARQTEMEPAFQIIEIARLWDKYLAGGPPEQVERANAEAWNRLQARGVQPHRAGDDVRHLMEMYQILALGF
jgi:hypothetical protein